MVPLELDEKRPWPPPYVNGVHLEAIRKDITEADAWYSGDPAKLSACYTTTSAAAPTIAERLAFWRGKANDPGQATRLHLPAAADIAELGADLLFGDVTAGNFVIPEAHEFPDAEDGKPVERTTEQIDAGASEERLREIIADHGVGSRLLEGAEIGGALGGVFMVPGWDPEVAQHPLLTMVHPDHAVPHFRHGVLTEVTLWSVVDVDGYTVVRHLEHHDNTGITHYLYVGNRDALGRRVKLDFHPATRDIAVNGDDHVDLPEGVVGLMPRYVPNRLPNVKHRGAPMGRSDTSKSITFMDSLDETWTSWMRDIRLAKGRLVVPDEFLTRAGGRGSGSTFDMDAEVFSPLRIDPESMKNGAASITIAQFEIRAEEHYRTGKALLEQIARSSGYNPQSYGLEVEGGGIKTATEVEAETDQSEDTTNKKRAYWQPAVEDVLFTMLCIDREQFGTKVTPIRPRLEWPTHDQDPQSLATSIELLNRAQAASIETKVKMLHGDWEQDQVQREVDAIVRESGVAMPDPIGGGLP